MGPQPLPAPPCPSRTSKDSPKPGTPERAYMGCAVVRATKVVCAMRDASTDFTKFVMGSLPYLKVAEGCACQDLREFI